MHTWRFKAHLSCQYMDEKVNLGNFWGEQGDLFASEGSIYNNNE